MNTVNYHDLWICCLAIPLSCGLCHTVMALKDFVRVHLSLSQSRRQLQDLTTLPKSNIEKRLLAIPLLFILLRIWGTLQFFYSLAVASQNHAGCIPNTVRNAFMIIGILQVRVRIINL